MASPRDSVRPLLNTADGNGPPEERREGDEGVPSASSFDIPELPSGQTLLIELLSAWDDPSLIGLRSVEIFASDGTIPPVADIQSNATEIIRGNLRSLFRVPISEEERDERIMEGQQTEKKRETVTERGDGEGKDEGMWLCKYNSEEDDQQKRRLFSSPIQIVAHFSEPQTLAMIRISNFFCPSDVHFALCGVRNVRIWLDDQCIFCGEICCAVGGESAVDSPSIGDTILFTTNEEILARIAENDEVMANDGGEEERKSTGKSAVVLPRLSPSTRPTTGNSANSVSASPCPSPSPSVTSPIIGENFPRQAHIGIGKEEREEEAENAIVGKVFHMELLANWGCSDAIGLTGIQFFGPNFEPIADRIVKECVVRCEPKSDESPKEEGQLANLLNGLNLTCQTDEMWLSSLWNAQGPAPMLSFTFPHEIRICGVSVWNYNGSLEMSYAGVRCARFYANGKVLPIGMVLLRKAPGFLFFDFVQDVLFDRYPLVRPSLTARPQTRSIAAFIFQIRLLSTWGDEFYIGLNGVELFNRNDLPIRLGPQNLAAFPESVNCLARVCGDPRSSDKLIDGVNDTAKARHMWLTPILPNSCARVFIIFDAPTFVTRIRIFNYRKTPERGARHIAISADDLLLCSGAEVPMSSSEKTGILDISLRDGDYP
ncbi:hypothetical protein niasHT_030452 [Heterodera trifolii]|uniref:KATNIP domain-containing protein n=1 Tax=Heterodera trifolii TaxID=157864 RepID=A0ABD2J738_9BILA